MKQPTILFLDEVTSALDAISESEVMKALSQLMVGRTTFIIAHRLHTLVNVDRIFVLKDGQINDFGTHAELSARPGFFRTMWEKQQGEASSRTVLPSISSAELRSHAEPGVNGGHEGEGKGVGEDVQRLLEMIEGNRDTLKSILPGVEILLGRISSVKKFGEFSFSATSPSMSVDPTGLIELRSPIDGRDIDQEEDEENLRVPVDAGSEGDDDLLM